MILRQVLKLDYRVAARAMKLTQSRYHMIPQSVLCWMQQDQLQLDKGAVTSRLCVFADCTQYGSECSNARLQLILKACEQSR